MVIVWAHILGTLLMRVVPVRVAHQLVDWLLPLVMPFAAGHEDRATGNMRQVLGPGAAPHEARSLARRSFGNYGRYMIDLLRLPSVDPAELLSRLDIEGWEHVEQAYDGGRGVVFATAHVGNWDLAGAAFAAHGRAVSALVETLRPESWNRRVQAIRERVGVRAIPVETGVREMLAALRRGEGLAILVDRPVQESGVAVTFFGRRTYVPGGAATLALRTGAPIVPAVVVRDPERPDWFRAHIGQPIAGNPGGRGPAEVQELTQHVMTWLEGMIRRYPDQWYMFRHMWPLEEQDNCRSGELQPGPAPI